MRRPEAGCLGEVDIESVKPTNSNSINGTNIRMKKVLLLV